MTVRTRIAPSPTGDPHVGTAYIALFNLCFARQHGGKFILRIEDTDQARSTAQSEQKIFNALRWLGLDWDEGPDVGGDYGPYRQSERTEVYQEHVQQLLDQGHAFHCFCTEGRLSELRARQMQEKQQPGYDGKCLSLSTQEVQKRQQDGEASVVRMKVPEEGRCEIDDYLRGKIEIDWAQVDMQVLMKADGMPTYHLANVVDDHLMKISHVIRGEEWISSAPKHKLLYQYFGWDMPVLCHMPLLRNPDKSKLSKRKNPTSITYYERMGYLPEALLNYLGRMGWSMPDEQEKFSLDEMITEFDLQRVSLGGPIFDAEKLNWLNGSWIRENLSTEQFADRVAAWAFNRNYLMQAAGMVKERVELLSDIAPLASFFVSGMLDVNEADFQHKKLEPAEVRRLLQFVTWRMETLQEWQKPAIEAAFMSLAGQMELKFRDFIAPIFIAITGKSSATPLMDSMVVLGPDISRVRLRYAVDVLGGVSKKEAKRWEKEYRALSDQAVKEK